MRNLYFFLAFLCCNWVAAQIVNKTDSNNLGTQPDAVIADSRASDSLKIFRPTITDYQSFTEDGPHVVLDTMMTQEKNYIFTQYNNRDNFGYLPFANIGAGFNPLQWYQNPKSSLAVLPTRKSFYLFGPEEIRYYDVKTPTTSFVFHNAVRQGVNLQTTYSQNIRKDFNVSVQYMGLRSQGNYSNELAAGSNVLFSTNFATRDGRYRLFAHFLDQNIRNQESGGLADVDLFLSNISAVKNRANLLSRLQDANTRFSYRRYYLSQQFRPVKSEKFPFVVQHILNYQSNKYYYGEPTAVSAYLGIPVTMEAYPSFTSKYSKNLSNSVLLAWKTEKFTLCAGPKYEIISIGTEDPPSVLVPQKATENRFGLVGDLDLTLLENFQLNSKLEISRGNLLNNFLSLQNQAAFQYRDFGIRAHANFQSAYPTLNLVLNASPYQNFNYYRLDYRNQSVLNLGGEVTLPWFRTRAGAEFYTVTNYTYLDSAARPQQASGTMNIAQITGDATFDYRKFHLNARVQFQKVAGNQDLYPIPNFLVRTNLYWQSKLFNNAAELQTGIKVNFFDKFASRTYFPLLNEFILPATTAKTVGGTPIVDLYATLKVKRMFIFLEGQSMQTVWGKNTLFTVPNYPYSDFRLNIGIVWYLIN